MTVTEVTARPGGFDRDAVLRLAAAAEAGSEHPVGLAIHASAVAVPPAESFTATAGVGVRAQVEGRLVEVVRPGAQPPEETGRGGSGESLPAATASNHDGEGPAGTRRPQPGAPGDEWLATALRRADDAGRTAVLVHIDGIPEAVIALGDTVRAGSYRAVDHLKRLGLRPVLATGDGEAPARAVAAELGITEVHARATPEDKAELVRTLREQGHRVAVIGDGVNDTAALAGADLGIAMGSGTDAAIGAADVTLVREDMSALADAVRLARRTSVTVRSNLAWAFGYNLVTLPLAAAGLLSPMVAAAAMSASSLLVVGNSLRLRTWQPSPSRGRTAAPASRGGAR
ncbi:hypothetical protein GCM10020000_68110 [Streptomyces olivoverticillatus]